MPEISRAPNRSIESSQCGETSPPPAARATTETTNANRYVAARDIAEVAPEDSSQKNYSAWKKIPVELVSKSTAAPKGESSRSYAALSDGTLQTLRADASKRLKAQVNYPTRDADTAVTKHIDIERSQRDAGAAAIAKQALSKNGVELCKRPADSETNAAMPRPLQVDHWWLRTTTQAAGMGPADGGVPGHGEGFPYGKPTTMNDHRHETPVECIPHPEVTEDCINSKLEIGKDLGLWTPPFNDCHTVVTNILDACEYKVHVARQLAKEDAGAN